MWIILISFLNSLFHLVLWDTFFLWSAYGRQGCFVWWEKASKSKHSEKSKTRISHSAKASKATHHKKSRKTVVLKPSKNSSSSSEKSDSSSDVSSPDSQQVLFMYSASLFLSIYPLIKHLKLVR